MVAPVPTVDEAGFLDSAYRRGGFLRARRRNVSANSITTGVLGWPAIRQRLADLGADSPDDQQTPEFLGAFKSRIAESGGRHQTANIKRQ